MATLDKMTKLNDYLSGFWKIAYLNLLWFAFSLLGLFLFGIGPATYAMTKYYDRWFRLKEEPPVFQTFWQYYQERFKQAVAISWIQGIILAVLVFNIFNVTAWFLQVTNVLMLVIFLVGSTHLYNVMAALTYETIREIAQASMMMGLGYLHYTIILWTIVLGVYYLLSITYSSLLLLFGIGFMGAAIAFTGTRIIADFESDGKKDEENIKNILKGESK